MSESVQMVRTKDGITKRPMVPAESVEQFKKLGFEIEVPKKPKPDA